MSHRNKMISVRISPFCELARWVMERQGVLYTEYSYAPIFSVIYTKLAGGGVAVPLVKTGDATLEIGALLEYLDARNRPSDRLYPADLEERREVQELVGYLLDDLTITVRRYAYAQMLPNRKVTSRLMTDGVPWWQRALVLGFYPLQVWALRKALHITADSNGTDSRTISNAFEKLSERLGADRPYLMGNTISMADFAFAAAVAPITLPPQYGAPFPKIEDLPSPMVEAVQAVRATAAGELAMRMYGEHRRAPFGAEECAPSTGERWTDCLRYWFQRLVASPALLRFISDLFRNRRPVLKAGQSALVFRNADVLDALNRDEALTIKEVNAARMDRISGPFVLGMDRSPQFDREDAAIMGVIKPGDLERIGRIVREAAEELIGAAWGLGRIDVAQEYSYPIAARVVEQYFGTPGPSEGVLIQWMHSLFWDVFQNRNNQQLVRRAADVSALELRNYLVELIPSRRGSKADDLLSRLVQSTGLDDEAVRRNITGIIVGAIDTTVTAVVSVMDELLKQPKAMELARAAAMANDIDRLRLCCFEALRYQPQTPALLRRSHSAVTLCSGKVIPGNSNVVLLTISAMFDPEAFPNPDVFRDDRPLDRYLHFGHGMHTCYGRHFNAVQIPEQVGCLLRAGAVRRESRVGFSGPFPDRLVVGFGR